MKTLLKIVIALVVVVLIVVGVVLMKIDSIAKTAIEKGGTYALGVQTTVDNVDISIFGGKFGMDGLTNANWEGYPAAYLLKSDHFDIEVEPGSIRTDTVVVEELTIDGIDIHIEKKDRKYNIQHVTDHLKSLSKAEDKPAEPKGDDKPGKQVKVNRLVIKNITATVDSPLGGKVTVNPPDIELENVTKDNVPVDQLIAQVFPAVMMGVVKSLPENLGGLAQQLGADLSGAAEALGGNAMALADQAGKQAVEAVNQALEEGTKAIQGVTEGAGKTIQGTTKGVTDGVGKTIEDATKGIGNGLGGLIDGEKKKQ